MNAKIKIIKKLFPENKLTILIIVNQFSTNSLALNVLFIDS